MDIPNIKTVKPQEFRKPHASKPAAKVTHKSHKKYLYISGAIFLLLALTAQALIVKEFIDTHIFKWQSPVVLQQPLLIKRSTDVVISPLPGEKGKTGMIDVGAITDKIYTLESSGGKNDGCRALGLYNGYGFRQNTSEWKCFSSHEEVRQLVINWLEDHIKQGDLEKALCLYNRGINEKGCTYAINYKSL